MHLKFQQILCIVVITFLIVVNADAAPSYLTHNSNVNMERAVANLTVKAEEGVAEAQYDLALHYTYGEGVEENDKLAFHWYEKASNQNLTIAKVDLATFYLEGAGGVDKDFQKAEFLLKQAAEQRSEEAHLLLARIYTIEPIKKDFSTASYWLKKAADQGSTKAMDIMALMFLDGELIEPDLSEAAYWFQRGSDAGNLGATYSLAICYLEGTVVA